MRILCLLLLAAAALAAPSATAGEHTVRAAHAPAAPRAGESVVLTLETRDTQDVQDVRAIYCRVQSYACGPALPMNLVGNDTWTATIPWTPKFLGTAKEVGYKFDLALRNGTNETNPHTYVPARPPDLPAEADVYYIYAITPAARSPSPGPGALIVLFAVVILVGRRP